MQKPPVFEHSARQAETSVAFAGAFAVPVAGFFAVAGGVAPWLVEVEGAWANRRPPSISPAATNFIEFELAGTLLSQRAFPLRDRLQRRLRVLREMITLRIVRIRPVFYVVTKRLHR
jgi:hypothetical protein